MEKRDSAARPAPVAGRAPQPPPPPSGRLLIPDARNCRAHQARNGLPRQDVEVPSGVLTPQIQWTAAAPVLIRPIGADTEVEVPRCRRSKHHDLPRRNAAARYVWTQRPRKRRGLTRGLSIVVHARPALRLDLARHRGLVQAHDDLIPTGPSDRLAELRETRRERDIAVAGLAGGRPAVGVVTVPFLDLPGDMKRRSRRPMIVCSSRRRDQHNQHGQEQDEPLHS